MTELFIFDVAGQHFLVDASSVAELREAAQELFGSLCRDGHRLRILELASGRRTEIDSMWYAEHRFRTPQLTVDQVVDDGRTSSTFYASIVSDEEEKAAPRSTRASPTAGRFAAAMRDMNEVAARGNTSGGDAGASTARARQTRKAAAPPRSSQLPDRCSSNDDRDANSSVAMLVSPIRHRHEPSGDASGRAKSASGLKTVRFSADDAVVSPPSSVVAPTSIRAAQQPRKAPRPNFREGRRGVEDKDCARSAAPPAPAAVAASSPFATDGGRQRRDAEPVSVWETAAPQYQQRTARKAAAAAQVGGPHRPLPPVDVRPTDFSALDRLMCDEERACERRSKLRGAVSSEGNLGAPTLISLNDLRQCAGAIPPTVVDARLLALSQCRGAATGGMVLQLRDARTMAPIDFDDDVRALISEHERRGSAGRTPVLSVVWTSEEAASGDAPTAPSAAPRSSANSTATSNSGNAGGHAPGGDERHTPRPARHRDALATAAALAEAPAGAVTRPSHDLLVSPIRQRGSPDAPRAPPSPLLSPRRTQHGTHTVRVFRDATQEVGLIAFNPEFPPSAWLLRQQLRALLRLRDKQHFSVTFSAPSISFPLTLATDEAVFQAAACAREAGAMMRVTEVVQ